jgi:uncharacterized protein (DUF983 family)
MSDASTFPAAVADPAETERPLWPAVALGWRRKCPACGEGDLLEGYLTVRDACPCCGEELHHQRADDGPAWLTIVVTGKLLAPVMLLVWELWRPEAWVMALGLSALFTAVSLYLLPRFKGGFVGFQWAKRMHGFGGAEDLPPRP